MNMDEYANIGKTSRFMEKRVCGSLVLESGVAKTMANVTLNKPALRSAEESTSTSLFG